MIGYQHHALGEVALYAAVVCLAQLAAHTGVAADTVGPEKTDRDLREPVVV